MDFYINKELAKKLKDNGCELESMHSHYVWTWEFHYVNYWWIYNYEEKEKPIPAYHILEDICVKYVEDFFDAKGNKLLLHFSEIIWRLQEGKKQEALDYIWENCLYNPKNKCKNT